MKGTAGIRKAYGWIAGRPLRNALLLMAAAILTGYVYLTALFESQGASTGGLLLEPFLFSLASWLAALVLFLFAEAMVIGFLSAANRSIKVRWKSFVPVFAACFAFGIVGYHLSALLWLKLLSQVGMPGLALNLLLSAVAALSFPIFNLIQLKRALRLTNWQAASVFLVTVACFGFWFLLLSVVMGSILYAPAAGLPGLD